MSTQMDHTGRVFFINDYPVKSPGKYAVWAESKELGYNTLRGVFNTRVDANTLANELRQLGNPDVRVLLYFPKCDL